MRAAALPLALAGVIALVWPIAPVLAGTTSFTGAAAAQITGFRGGAQSGQDSDSATFSDPNGTLPLQVVARLVDPNNASTAGADAAGVVGAQLADPRTSSGGADTDEFAIDLALSSISTEISYTAQATSEELRNILYAPGELGPESAGATVQLEGRVFVDGAVAIFADQSAMNFTGAFTRLRVTVTKQVEGQSPEQVFLGTLELTGGADRQVTPTHGGNFPTAGIFTTDLSSVDASLSVFQVMVFPNLAINYPFDAVVGQAFTLHAVVEVDAQNVPGGVGVAAVNGTPVSSLNNVVSLTRGSAPAAKMSNALQQERSQPTGEPTFATQNPQPGLFGLFSLCGLLGFESVLGFVALVGLRVWNPYRRGGRRQR